jgi:hypothetical protein
MKIKTEADVTIYVVEDFGITISFDKTVRALGLNFKEAKKLSNALLSFIPFRARPRKKRER